MVSERFLLDTNIVVFALRRTSRAVLARLVDAADALAVSTITETELAYGVERSVERERNAVATAEFLSRVEVLPFDGEAARRAGEVRARLAEQGTPIGAYDVLLAGHALATGRTLVTNNVREFARVPGLRVDDWVR